MMQGNRRNGGQLLVECLLALGARHGFGVPGESYLAVLDALHDTRGRLDYILCRQEGGAAFMAAAYGKLTGSPGIAWVTRGPGATNAAIGVHTAMQDSAPMILFVGQVGTDMKGREAFQEVDYRAAFGPLAKWAVEIDDVDRIPEIVARAWKTALVGRPGPVVVALPENMLTSLTEVPALTGPARYAEAAPEPAALDEARAMLAGARRPLILYGGGNWSQAGRAVRQPLARLLRRGRGGHGAPCARPHHPRRRDPRAQRALRRDLDRWLYRAFGPRTGAAGDPCSRL
jgi:acetolactate synthase-1/2/3 large subunit